MGKLVVVPTPVGNLQDMTFRAVEVLKSADLILAEDTRTSGNLLKHFGIETKMMSHHKFNEHATIERTLDIIRTNSVTALISDAGTPSISDPGYFLTKHCVENDIEVECLPGATAFVPALVMNRQILFRGFSPSQKRSAKQIIGIERRNTHHYFLRIAASCCKNVDADSGIYRRTQCCRSARNLKNLPRSCPWQYSYRH